MAQSFSRLVRADGTTTVRRLNARGLRVNDLYYSLLTMPRWAFAGLLVAGYLGINLAFGLGYLLAGGIENARPGSFLDAFFFSVQTMATIGYGRLVPTGLIANILVTVEAGLGLFVVAMAAALMFARFTRADAGVIFSQKMVVSPINGIPTLMFRLANERANMINEARLHVVMLEYVEHADGEIFRKLHDLHLTRSFNPAFALSWTVMHPIDEKSPLFGRTPAELEADRIEFFVMLAGNHEGLRQDVHARFGYSHEDIAWGMRFADLFTELPDGTRAIDYALFDDLLPVGPA